LGTKNCWPHFAADGNAELGWFQSWYRGRSAEVPPGGFVPQPEEVEQGTQTWAQELQQQENIQAPPVQEPLLRRSGNSLHQ
jgi:hypothetical protein